MRKQVNQTASAGGQAIPDEKQILARTPNATTDNPKLAAIPPQSERRFESGEELKTFLDEKEMLRRLPISRRTLFNWRESGKIPVVKIGRRCLYHFPSIEAALLRMQRGGEAGGAERPSARAGPPPPARFDPGLIHAAFARKPASRQKRWPARISVPEFAQLLHGIRRDIMFAHNLHTMRDCTVFAHIILPSVAHGITILIDRTSFYTLICEQ